MKTWKQGIIGILAIIALTFAFTACDDGKDNGKDETPSVPQPKTITQTNGLAFDGTVTIRTSDLYLNADWDAVVASVITALNTAYNGGSGTVQARFRIVFGNMTDNHGNGGNGVEIVLVNNLTNNWEVRDGEIRTLYLKTGSIATADYATIAQRMNANIPDVGKATPLKNRVFLIIV